MLFLDHSEDYKKAFGLGLWVKTLWGGHLSDCAPHLTIVMKMEDTTSLLLLIIVSEMPSVSLMTAIRNVQTARPTLYQVMKELVDKMGYEVGNEAECMSFDLRLSDAINIAVRCKLLNEFGLNEFVDLSHQEFKNLYLGLKVELSTQSESIEEFIHMCSIVLDYLR
ncbi:hypothetical protein RIF29_20412 [Crotalaria pallida]|uniref:Uncharacterized protein n=1 Tax=Crotalaria pallida TaxID=3830 RepID=A0AAN9F5H1_CROPI